MLIALWTTYVERGRYMQMPYNSSVLRYVTKVSEPQGWEKQIGLLLENMTKKQNKTEKTSLI